MKRLTRGLAWLLAAAVLVSSSTGMTAAAAELQPEIVAEETVQITEREAETAIPEDEDASVTEESEEVGTETPSASDNEPTEPSDSTESDDRTPPESEDEPSVPDKEPSVSENEPSATDNEPSVSENEPSAPDNEPSVSENEPSVSDNEPSVSENELSVSENELSVSENELQLNGKAALPEVQGFEELMNEFPTEVSGSTTTIIIDHDINLTGDIYFYNSYGATQSRYILKPQGNRTIYYGVGGTETMPTYGGILVPDGKTLCLGTENMGAGNTLTLHGGGDIRYESNAWVNKGDVSHRPAVDVSTGSTLEMYDGVTITQFVWESGVLYNTDGTIRIRGGEITKNWNTSKAYIAFGNVGIILNRAINWDRKALLEISGGRIYDNLCKNAYIGNRGGKVIIADGELLAVVSPECKELGEWVGCKGIDMYHGDLYISGGTINNFSQSIGVIALNEKDPSTVSITGGSFSGLLEKEGNKSYNTNTHLFFSGSVIATVSNTVLECADTGISISDRRKVIIDQCKILHVNRGVFLEPDTKTDSIEATEPLIFSDSTISEAFIGIDTQAPHPDYMNSVKPIQMKGNALIEKCTLSGVRVEYGNYFQMDDGTIRDCDNAWYVPDQWYGEDDLTGAGIHNKGECVINGGVIENCVTQYGGGGIGNAPARFQIDQETGKFILDENGNHIVAYRPELTINGGIIQNNRTEMSGGGISNYGMLNFNGGTVQYNTAFAGGGINSGSTFWFRAEAIFTMNGGTVQKNIAELGGGLFLSMKEAHLINGSVIQNKAKHDSGIVIDKRCNATISDTFVIADNEDLGMDVDPMLRYTVTFDGAGGSEVAPISGIFPGDCIELPVPTKTNEIFLGWFTEPDGKGTQFTKDMPVTKNMTLYAYWRADLIKEGYRVAVIPNQTYTGGKVMPKPKVYKDNVLLTEGNDYAVSYANCVETGKATVKVTINGRSGSLNMTYLIMPKNISEADISVTVHNSLRKGENSAALPDMELIYEGRKLVAGRDYTAAVAECTADKGTVKISGKGNFSGTRKASFTIVTKKIADVKVTAVPTQYYMGAPLQPKPEVKDKAGVPLTEGVDYNCIYSKNVRAGKATLEIRGTGAYAGTKKVSFTIAKKPVASADITVTVPNIVYNGQAQKPAVTVSDGGRLLTEKIDYTLRYSANKNASEKACVTVTGKGNYQGTRKTFFTIAPKDIRLVTATAEDGLYKEGTEIKGKVTVKDGKVTLRVNRDYTIAYKDNTAIGTATAVITGKGNYTGVSESIPFRVVSEFITKATVSKITPLTYTGTVEQPQFEVFMKGTKLTEGEHYRVECPAETNTKAGTAKLYIVGLGMYGGRKTVSYKINKRPLASENTDFTLQETAPVVFNGGKTAPKIALSYRGVLLTEGTDYRLSYQKNVNVSDEAVISIQGRGSYTGTWKTTYTILPAKITDTIITAADIPYRKGKAAAPKLVVKYGKYTLRANKDYVLFYGENKECKDGTVNVKGIGNYAALAEETVTVPYHVYETAITKAKIDKLPTIVITEDEALEPELTIRYGGRILKEDEDYTLQYDMNMRPGKGKVTIRGIGKFGGTRALTFKIAQKKVAE